ncbi:MAG: FtsK/SpoIIIE domain-containing protein [Actinomycetota bacterium]
MRVVHRRRDHAVGAIGPATDRTVDLDLTGDELTASHLAAALDPRPVVPRPGLVIDGRWSAPDTPVDQLDLRNGSLVEPTPTPPDPTPMSARSLAVVGGIDAGVAVAVPDRSFTVGRAASCDVVLDDPTVSRRPVVVAPTDDDEVVTTGTTQWVVRAEFDDRPHAVREGLGRTAGLQAFNRPPRAAPPVDTPSLCVPTEVGPAETVEPPSIAGIVLPVVAGTAMAVLFSPMFAVFTVLGPLLGIGTWWERRRRARRQHRRAVEQLDVALEALRAELPELVADEIRRRRTVVPDIAEVVRRARVGSVRLWERRVGDPDAFRCGIAGVRGVFEPASLTSDGPPAQAASRLLADAPPLHDVPLEVTVGPGTIVGVVGPPEARQAVGRSLAIQLATHHGPADLGLLVAAEAPLADGWAWTCLLPHTVDPGTGNPLDGAVDHRDTDIADARLGDDTAAMMLVVVDGDTAFEGRNTVGRRAIAASAAVIALVEDPHRLPAGCSAVATVDRYGRLQLVDPRRVASPDRGLAWGIGADVATEAARGLAQFDDPELARSGAGVPDRTSLLGLLGIDGDDPAAIERRWSARRGSADLSAPIGADAAGVLHLDLVRDGPHVLVGGTTGAGKSELLRSLVASFAASADPDHLAFVLIDYKGGAAFDCCAALPHVTGLVTDLDPDTAARALEGLDAELTARERRLRLVGAEDLAAHRRLTRSRDDVEPLPRLVIVIDEFASLAADLPEFLDSLVGIAQRGRSLGVHLVLATQRPGGVVTDDIRANTGCRIALRVTDGHESNDVVGAPDAAAIPRSRPGRAVARLGPGELVGFQSALVTGRTATADPVRVRPVGAPMPPEPSSNGPTDLERLVATVIAAHGNAPRPSAPWPDPLPTTASATRAGWWMVDRPAEQAQTIEGWVPADGHLVVVGGPGTGTSTTLANAALVAIDLGAHVYGIDGDAGMLGRLGELPAVGTVTAPLDAERRIRLLRWLAAEVDRRRGADHAGDPPIVMLIDDLGSLARAHDPVRDSEPHDALAAIWSDGPAVGVVVVTSLRRAADLPAAYGAGAGTVLVHDLLDEADAHRFGLRRLPDTMPPGRAVRARDGALLQVLLVDGDLDAALPARTGLEVDPAPRCIGTLPARIVAESLPIRSARRTDGSLRIPIGVRDHDLEVAELVLDPGVHALVLGPSRSGRTTTLETVARAVPSFVVVGDADSVLAARLGVETLDPLDAAFGAALDAAFDGALDSSPTVVLVDDADQVHDAAGRLLALATEPPPGVHIVAAARTDRLRNGFGHWCGELRAGRTGVLVQPDPLDGDLLGAPLPGRLGLEPRPGRGLVVNASRPESIQVATP